MSNDGTSALDLFAREVSHALNTPLAHLEVTARTALQDRDTDLEASITEMISSIELCKAFVSSFKTIAGIARTASSWQPDSLQRAVTGAFQIYAAQHGRGDVELNLYAPEEVFPYPNDVILVLLIPLLENAIEAAAHSTMVEVTVEKRLETPAAARLLIAVKNTVEVAPEPDKMMTTGYTSKGEDHEGLGLRIVEDLAMRLGGGVTIEINEVAGQTVVELVVKLSTALESPLEAADPND